MTTFVIYSGPARERGGRFSHSSLWNLMEYVTDKRTNLLNCQDTTGTLGDPYRRIDYMEGGVIVYSSFKGSGPRKGLRSFLAVRGPEAEAQRVRDILLKTIESGAHNR